MRNGALVRVLTMADRLRAGRRTLEELAQEFHVSTRTVRRDLEVLSVAGVRIRRREDTGEGFTSYWWVERETTR